MLLTPVVGIRFEHGAQDESYLRDTLDCAFGALARRGNNRLRPNRAISLRFQSYQPRAHVLERLPPNGDLGSPRGGRLRGPWMPWFMAPYRRPHCTSLALSVHQAVHSMLVDGSACAALLVPGLAPSLRAARLSWRCAQPPTTSAYRVANYSHVAHPAGPDGRAIYSLRSRNAAAIEYRLSKSALGASPRFTR